MPSTTPRNQADAPKTTKRKTREDHLRMKVAKDGDAVQCTLKRTIVDKLTGDLVEIICGRICASRSKLNRHQRSTSIHNPDAILTAKCGQQIYRADNVRSHTKRCAKCKNIIKAQADGLAKPAAKGASPGSGNEAIDEPPPTQMRLRKPSLSTIPSSATLTPQTRFMHPTAVHVPPSSASSQPLPSPPPPRAPLFSDNVDVEERPSKRAHRVARPFALPSPASSHHSPYPERTSMKRKAAKRTASPSPHQSTLSIDDLAAEERPKKQLRHGYEALATAEVQQPIHSNSAFHSTPRLLIPPSSSSHMPPTLPTPVATPPGVPSYPMRLPIANAPAPVTSTLAENTPHRVPTLAYYEASPMDLRMPFFDRLFDPSFFPQHPQSMSGPSSVPHATTYRTVPAQPLSYDPSSLYTRSSSHGPSTSYAHPPLLVLPPNHPPPEYLPPNPPRSPLSPDISAHYSDSLEYCRARRAAPDSLPVRDGYSTGQRSIEVSDPLLMVAPVALQDANPSEPRPYLDTSGSYEEWESLCMNFSYEG